MMMMNISKASFLQRAVRRWGRMKTTGHNTRALQIDSSMIEVSHNVSQALKNDEPIVALESTIITHGMPYPANLETALKVESTVKAQGAIPATIGIIKGRVHVGLNREELEMLASMKEPCLKTSRRDFPYVLSKKLNGGTTVSGTMLVAAKAGISIFVTGGIGGVHRGAQETFDVSADLTELGRTPVAVVSSGVKSILDIGKTLEYLETQGVCVATLGPRNDFPAFFTPSSGFRSPYHLETTAEAARLIYHNIDSFKTGSGLLIAVPIPESSQADGQAIEVAIQAALTLADQEHVRGKDVTPFVLSQVNRLTSGASLVANMALIEHNASVGAAIAVDLARLRRSGSTQPPPPQQSLRPTVDDCPTVVIGGSIVDLVAAVKENSIQMDASTHRGSIRRSYGGVGRNLADGLSRLGRRPLFLSVVGDDESGRDLIRHNPSMESRGVLRLDSESTASYTVILDNKGDCQFGIGDFNIHDKLTVDKVRQYEEDIAKCRLLIMDGNIGIPTMEYILAVCHSARVPVWYEPTDVRKASKPLEIVEYRSAIAYTSPNLAELKRMVGTIQPGLPYLNEVNLNQTIEEIQEPLIKACRPLLDTMQCVMITLGKLGMMIVRRGHSTAKLPLAPWQHQPSDEITATYYPAPAIERIVSVSGAGDCLASGFIAGILNGWKQDKCAALGLQAAACSLQHSPAVPEALSNLKPCSSHVIELS